MKSTSLWKKSTFMLGVMLLLTLQLTSIVLAAAKWEQLAYGFSDFKTKGYSTHDWENHYTKSYWNAISGHNCTNYAAYMLSSKGASAEIKGNASNWAVNAKAAGYTVNNTPAIGSIAQWNGNSNLYVGSAGHVAYVEEVTDSYIIVSEDNYEKDIRMRKIYKDDLWPSNFIHISSPVTVTISSEIALNGKFIIRSKIDPSKVADVGTHDDGAAIILWPYAADNKSQIFTITHLGGNKHSIINDATGKAMEVSNSTHDQGGRIQQWAYKDLPTMQWKIIEHNTGYYSLVNCNSGLYFDLNNGDIYDGNHFHQWNNNGTDAQLFTLEKVQDTAAAQKKYYVYSGYTYSVGSTKWYTYSENYALSRSGSKISVTLDYELPKGKVYDGYQSYLDGSTMYYYCDVIYK